MSRRSTIKGGGGSTAWPGTSSQLTSGAGGAVTVGTGLKLSSNTLAPSQTVFDVDFTALSDATQTLSNGNVTIGGVTYKVENAANASSIQFVNGSGFVIAGKSVGGASSQWNYAGGSPNNQRTAPAVLLPFSSILTATGVPVTAASRVRVFAYITAQSFGSDDSNVFLCVDNDGAAGATMYSALTVRGWIGTGPAGQINVGGDYVMAGSQTGDTVATALTGSACNVIGVEVDSLLPRMYTSYYGAWSSGWPAQSALSLRIGAGTPATTAVDVTARSMKAIAMAFAGVTGGTGATVARLRVDVW